MKLLLILLTTIFAIGIATDEDKFEEFKKTYGREYANQTEESLRFEIFQQNLRKIEKHNSKYHNGEESYYMGITPFTDITTKEFHSMLNYGKSSSLAKPYAVTDLSGIPDSSVPTSMDWNTEGILTDVKDQGFCGSSWAFAATGVMEAAYAIKTGSKIDLSEQNLMDCSSLYGTAGCNGGIVEHAYKYVRDYGIETEKEYPYSAKTEEGCKFIPSSSVMKVNTYHTLTSGDETVLKKAVATVGPIAVAMNAEQLQFYSGGIFYDQKCDRVLNHGMLVVGYGTSEDTPYWIIKNSWGPHWGENGYFRMIRDKHNQCGIADDATFPVIAD